jgi:nucleoside-diphosphate-sugar epimerase
MGDVITGPGADPTRIADPVLVTGANGFLGRRIVARLRARGAPVRALVRRAPGSADAPPWADDPGVEVIICDLSTEGVDLSGAVSGIRAAIHAAAAMSAGDAGHGANTLAPTRRLIDAICAADGPRPVFVLVSSYAVYGYAALPEGSALDETVPTEPDPHLRDAYARAKIAQEAMAIAAAQRRDLPVRILRPGAIYGPGRLWTARLGFRKGPLAVVPGGGASVPAVSVIACADALALAALAPAPQVSDTPLPRLGAGVEVFNVVDDDAPSQDRWLAAVSGALGVKKTVHLPARRMFQAAKALGLSEIVSAALPACLPGPLRDAALAARFKPLRHVNARLKARLGWVAGADFDADMRAACAGEDAAR